MEDQVVHLKLGQVIFLQNKILLYIELFLKFIIKIIKMRYM